ncbi:hypothetical protein GQ53DRAFT_881303 [Thozetella sp. PMI_491]|nr:hypothetical protein GQ53DRAFT_881303 [Thozetella sp. PMI_491]
MPASVALPTHPVANGHPAQPQPIQPRLRQRSWRRLKDRIYRATHSVKSTILIRYTRLVRKKGIPGKKVAGPLSLIGLLSQFLTQATVIFMILLLRDISNRINGIASVPNDTPPSFNDAVEQGTAEVARWTYSLLWTTVPTWILSLHAAAWSSTVKELHKALPIIELMREDVPSTSLGSRTKGAWNTITSWFGHRQPGPSLTPGSTAKKTMLLDYERYWPIKDAFMAYRNQHYVIGTCMLIKVLLFLATGFSAAIFSIGSASSNSTASVVSDLYFDDWTYGTLPDMQSTFDVVDTTLITNLTTFPWTSPTHSFQPFSVQNSTKTPRPPLRGNLTASTLAYYSSLDCVRFTRDNVSISVTDSGTPEGVNQTIFEFNDRNCGIVGRLSLTSYQRRYVQTWTNVGCPGYAGHPGHGDPWRLGIIAGDLDESSDIFFANLSIISCIPSVWNASAEVTILADEDDFGQVVSAMVGSPAQIRPLQISSLLRTFPEYQISEPVGDPNTTVKLDSFSRLVYKYAGSRNHEDFFTTDVLADSIPAVFNALFGVFTTSAAYSKSDTVLEANAIVTAPDQRLFVTEIPAMCVVGIMAVCVVGTFWVGLYVFVHQKALVRAHDSLFGPALLFQHNLNPDSELMAYIKAVEQDVEGRNGDVVQSDLVVQAQKQAGLYNWRCWLDQANDFRLRLQGPQAHPATAAALPGP